ncbi:MAG: electron transport complex subunit RsxB [Hydrogenovibrio sp.]|uniref:electron transport complex subunit RsxB n=1 Tax=Hydrogenovibrio sp. TaxID=2065821 RepID=UPI00286FCABF|nr:electron transport complex subunit RsxB [Hydrogenovibrio sp.]MDR9499526.1 electron transport complex subunit RsxB [Hydrogenovibrio sp.]
MIEALLVFLVLALFFGMLLGYAKIKFKVEGNPVADQIDSILPQTQCGQCGFPGCRPYAEALAEGNSEVNLCVPGGHEVMIQISEITHREPKEMDASNPPPEEPMVAVIDEDICIGCVHCIKACPVDAIVGTTKMMHTVIEKECTGCELCVPVCPVDCIDMVPLKKTPQTWHWPEPNANSLENRS